MSTSDRLDEIRARIIRAREGRHTDRHMVLDVDAPAMLAALRAVLDVCEGLEEAHRANPKQAYEYGLEEAAHQVRNTTDTRYVHLPCPHCGWHP